MNLFKCLSVNKIAPLLEFSAYTSMLANSSSDKLDETEEETAIKFVHTKSFTCDPLLAGFYMKADKAFK